MLEAYAQQLVNSLHAHPNWGLALAFFVAFIESLAVIGTIVPGSITLTVIGALIGSGVMPATLTFLIVVIGALTGDLLSYWFGRYYDQRLTKMWPFSTHPQWITAGELFFEKHGGKSVIIGRFFGPVRSFVPLIAGLLHMNPLYFALAAIPSASLWAIAYLLPGVLIGALSTELPPHLATKFIFFMLLALVVIWLLIWLTKFIIQSLWGAIDRAVSSLWQAMRARKAWHFITTPLADPREPNLHEQLMLALGAIVSIILLFIFLWNITHHGILTALNQPVHAFLQSIRIPILDSIMTVFTLLGDRKCILSFSVAILCWLTWQRQWRAAAHWLLLMILVIGSALAIKEGYYSPRPSADLPSNSTSSLPSGHTIFTLAFFGFLAVLIGHELPREKRKLYYKIALILVLLATFSRIYLGPHWLTDVIASFLLGLTCVLLVTISYRRHLTSHLSPKKLAVASVTILLTLWTSYSVWKYPETFEFHRQQTAILQLTSSDWWNKANDHIPVVRNNRFGNPTKPLNVQWQGSLAAIKQQLINQGWESHSSRLDLTGIVERISLQDPKRRLPLLPQLFNNGHPVLLMTKQNTKNHYDVVIYLWQSNIQLHNSRSPLWIGTLEKYENPHETLFRSSANEKYTSFTDVLPTLLNDVSALKTTLIILSPEKLRNIPESWRWNGKILQVSE